jgi:hypothetical protein
MERAAERQASGLPHSLLRKPPALAGGVFTSSRGHAPAIAHWDAPSGPRPHTGLAQWLGRVRLHAHRRPDGGRARGSGWRAVARLAAAGHWLPRSGYGAPAFGRGDGHARCRDPAQARRQADGVDAAQIVSICATCSPALAVCQATCGEQAAGDITHPSTPLPTFSSNSLCCLALPASAGMQVDGSEMSFPACWQMSPDTVRNARLIRRRFSARGSSPAHRLPALMQPPVPR